MDAPKTRIFDGNSEHDLREASSMLKNGALVAFPTETVYGLGACAFNQRAVQRIFEAKQRPSTNPLIVHVHHAKDVDACFDWTLTSPEFRLRLSQLEQHFWPGPLTIIGPKHPSLPSQITSGHPKVAIRIPNHPIAQRLLSLVGEPVVAPSANMANRPSPTQMSHVLKTLSGRIDAVVDGGPCSFGIESTVVDITGARPVILRPGALSRAQIEDVIGPTDKKDEEIHRAQHDCSPGQFLKHYAPNVDRVSLARSDELPIYLKKDCFIIVRQKTAALLSEHDNAENPTLFLMPDDPIGFAQKLFEALHFGESAQPRHLVIEKPSDVDIDLDSAWEGAFDRISRAAG